MGSVSLRMSEPLTAPGPAKAGRRPGGSKAANPTTQSRRPGSTSSKPAGLSTQRSPTWTDRTAWTRDDRWGVADRAAWGECANRFRPEFADLNRRLRSALDPLGSSQIVHADLTCSILFSSTLPPAVIDISPLWRPPAYAEGIVVADALCWHDAQASLLDQAGVSVAAVARALLFRMATTDLAVSFGIASVDANDEARRYEHAAAAIVL